MNPKYDMSREDQDEDFESTHQLIVRYSKDGNRQLDIATQRLLWEQKVNRTLAAIKEELTEIRDIQSGSTTGKFVALAQAEIRSAPVSKFYAWCSRWAAKIVGYLAAAGATALAGWWFSKH